MCVIAALVIGLAVCGLARIPTGFLPIEDQGYVLVMAQLPDGASLARTARVLDQVQRDCTRDPARRERHRNLWRVRARQQLDARQ